MEYLSGRDLFRILSESSYELTESKCKVFASQILSALGTIPPALQINLYVTKKYWNFRDMWGNLGGIRWQFVWEKLFLMIFTRENITSTVYDIAEIFFHIHLYYWRCSDKYKNDFSTISGKFGNLIYVFIHGLH